jgi:electron transport complex protein RnfD
MKLSAKALVSGPHAHAETRTPHIMRQVILALLPTTVFGILLFGWPALWLLLVTLASAALCEALCLKLAGRPALATLHDGSALLTGWLLAMTLPPWAPWWIGAVGSAIAIVLGKQVFGGLGQNLFNPAMLARVALLVSFPVEMTTWITPHGLFGGEHQGFLDSFGITFGGTIPDADGVTGATFIGAAKTGFSDGQPLSATLDKEGYGFLSSAFGLIRGSLGETSTVLILAGGLYLLKQRIITWQIPASLLLTVVLLATAFHAVDPERYADAGFHLTTGALMFAAFFIATDYVTSPNSPLGQLVFGAGCGLIVFVIRTWGGYPEGVGFAVLLMNAMTPLIDHYIRPRIYGRDRRGKPLELP